MSDFTCTSSTLSFHSPGLEEEYLPSDILGVEREIKVFVNRGAESKFTVGYVDIVYKEGETRVLVEEVYPGEEHDGLILEELISTPDKGPLWIQKWDAFEWKAHRILEGLVTEQMEKELDEQFKKKLIHGI